MLEGIRTAGDTIGEGMRSFLSDPPAVAAAAAAVGALALGIYGARYGARLEEWGTCVRLCL